MIASMSDMQQLVNVDPGPTDHTQLMRQLAHRSTALWGMPAIDQVHSCTKLWTFQNHMFFFLLGFLIICE